MSILSILDDYENTYIDHVNREIHELDLCEELIDCPTIQFIQEQLTLILYNPESTRRSYSKYTVMFSMELLGVSPAAYRLVTNSKTLIPPTEKTLRSLISNTFNDENLKTIIENLQPQQRIVNILFGEVKLKKATQYFGNHLMGINFIYQNISLKQFLSIRR